MRHLLTSLAVAGVALSVTACGSDSGGGGGKAVTFKKGQPIKVSGSEYKFDPGDITVEGGGGPATVEFSNDGSLAHNLRLEQGGQEVGGTPTFQGGETKSAQVDLRPGTYDMICTVGNHASLGMKGKLTVK
jgi:plastocyanin